MHVRSRSEALAASELRHRGFETFLPLRRVRRQWSDRVKILDQPLFPGYLFCRFRVSDRLRVLNAPGVAHILGVRGTPVPVSEAEIGSVETLTASSLALLPWPCIHAGQPVKIRRGPLAGVEGVIVEAGAGKPRVVVSVHLLNRAVSAEIEREWVDCARPQ